jgi:N,N'-diacetyllegionaminate synthase
MAINGPAYIVAEVGSSHERSLEIAKAMIHGAKGADAVKFQYFSSGEKVAARRKAPEYAAMYEQYRLPDEWLPILRDETKACGMDFICTVYMEADIATVAPYVDRFKVASPDALDTAFIDAHLYYAKPIMISVGLLTNNELLCVLAYRAKRWANYDYNTVKLLHCVSAYPCPVEQVNLNVIESYNLDGYSDHTGHAAMGGLAYMAGARIIEVHVRRDDTPKNNPDYPHSLDPASLKNYVAGIRLAEQVRGDRKKATQEAEAPLRRFLA